VVFQGKKIANLETFERMCFHRQCTNLETDACFLWFGQILTTAPAGLVSMVEDVKTRLLITAAYAQRGIKGSTALLVRNIQHLWVALSAEKTYSNSKNDVIFWNKKLPSTFSVPL